MTAKNYITPAGFQRLREELKTLLHQERPDLVKVVQWAASNGDRSENGDYIYGKRKLREIDRRIRFLQKRIEMAEVVDRSGESLDRVLFGANVKIEDEEGEIRSYQIVGEDEIDPKQGKVSWKSPIARALLNAKVGQVVSFRSPQGEQEIVVLEIRYG